MAHAEYRVVVSRPIGAVFEFLAEGANNPRWRPAVLEIRPGPEPAGVGQTFAQQLKGPMGRPIRGDYRITRWEPPHLLAFVVTAGPARPTGSYMLVEAGPGDTELTFVLDLPPRGLLGRLMDGMVARTMRAEVANLEQLKTVLEADAQPAG